MLLNGTNKQKYKKVGIINSIFIVVAIVIRLIQLEEIPNIAKFDSFFCVVALLYGVIYALSGYKKEDAKYYKAFMFLFLVSSILSFIASVYLITIISTIGFNLKTIEAVLNFVIIVCSAVLAFGKNLGKKIYDIVIYCFYY